MRNPRYHSDNVNLKLETPAGAGPTTSSRGSPTKGAICPSIHSLKPAPPPGKGERACRVTVSPSLSPALSEFRASGTFSSPGTSAGSRDTKTPKPGAARSPRPAPTPSSSLEPSVVERHGSLDSFSQERLHTGGGCLQHFLHHRQLLTRERVENEGAQIRRNAFPSNPQT